MATNTIEAPSQDPKAEKKRAEAELARKKMQEVTLITQDIQSHADSIKRMGAIAYRNEGTRKAVEGHADYINGKAQRAKKKLETILASIAHSPMTSKSVLKQLQLAQRELDANLQKAKADWEKLKTLPRGPVAEVKKTKQQEQEEAKALDKQISGGSFIAGAATRAKARLRSILERAKTYSREKVTAIPSATVRQMVRKKLEAAPLDNLLDARTSVETRSKERQELIQAIENTLELVHGRTKSEFIASHLEVLTAAPAIPESFFATLEASLQEKKEAYNAKNKDAELPSEGSIIPLINKVDRELHELKKEEAKKGKEENAAIGQKIDKLDKEKQRLAQLQQIFNLERTLQTAKIAQEKENTLIQQLKELQKAYTTVESATNVDEIRSAKTMIRSHRRVIKELTATPNKPVSGQDVEERLAHEITVQAPDNYSPVYFSEEQINDYELHPESFGEWVETIVDNIETITTDRTLAFVQEGARIIQDAKKLATSKVKRVDKKKMILSIDYRIKELTASVNAHEASIKPKNFSKREFEGFLQRPQDFADAVEVTVRGLDFESISNAFIASIGQIDGGFLSREIKTNFAETIIAQAKQFEDTTKDADKFALFTSIDTRITAIESLIETYADWLSELPEAKGELHDESYTTLPFKRGLVQRLGKELLDEMTDSANKQAQSDSPVKKGRANRLVNELNDAIYEYNDLAESAVTPNYSQYQLDLFGRDINDPEAVRETIEAKLEQVGTHYLLSSTPIELEQGRLELFALTEQLNNPELNDEQKTELIGQIAFMLTSYVRVYEAMAEEDSRMLAERSFYELDEAEIVQYIDKPEGFAMIVDDTLHQIAELYHSSGDTSQLPEGRQELVQIITMDTQLLIDAKQEDLTRKERIQIITTIDRALHELGNEVLLDVVERENNANAIIDHYKNQITPLWIEKYGRDPEPDELPTEVQALLNGAAIDPESDRSLQREQLAELDKALDKVKKVIEAEQILRLEVTMRFGEPPQLFLENRQYDAQYDNNPNKLVEDVELISRYLQETSTTNTETQRLLDDMQSAAQKFTMIHAGNDIPTGFQVKEITLNQASQPHMLPLQIRNINRAIMKIVNGDQPEKTGTSMRFADLGKQNPETGLYDGPIGASTPEQEVDFEKDYKSPITERRKAFTKEWETKLTSIVEGFDKLEIVNLTTAERSLLNKRKATAINLAKEYIEEAAVAAANAQNQEETDRISVQINNVLDALSPALFDIANDIVSDQINEDLEEIRLSSDAKLLDVLDGYTETKSFTQEQINDIKFTLSAYGQTKSAMERSKFKTVAGKYTLDDWRNGLDRLITRMENLLSAGTSPNTEQPTSPQEIAAVTKEVADSAIPTVNESSRDLLKEIEDALQEALDSPELSRLINKSTPEPQQTGTAKQQETTDEPQKERSVDDLREKLAQLENLPPRLKQAVKRRAVDMESDESKKNFLNTAIEAVATSTSIAPEEILSPSKRSDETNPAITIVNSLADQLGIDLSKHTYEPFAPKTRRSKKQAAENEHTEAIKNKQTFLTEWDTLASSLEKTTLSADQSELFDMLRTYISSTSEPGLLWDQSSKENLITTLMKLVNNQDPDEDAYRYTPRPQNWNAVKKMAKALDVDLKQFKVKKRKK